SEAHAGFSAKPDLPLLSVVWGTPNRPGKVRRLSQFGSLAREGTFFRKIPFQIRISCGRFVFHGWAAQTGTFFKLRVWVSWRPLQSIVFQGQCPFFTSGACPNGQPRQA